MEYDPIGTWDGWANGVRAGLIKSFLPGDIRVLRLVWETVSKLDTPEADRVRKEMRFLPADVRAEIGITE